MSHREAPPPSKGILKRPSFKHKLGSERQECIQGEEGRAALLAGGGFTRTKGKKLMRPQPGLRLLTSYREAQGYESEREAAEGGATLRSCSGTR